MVKEYITLALKDITPYVNNPRINDNAIPYVEDSIQQVGYIAPIIVDENNVILAGHTRLIALQHQNGGGSSVEVLRVSGLSEEAKKKYRYYDNKAGEFAAWDFEKLEEELNGFDLGAFDIDFGDDGDQEAYGQGQNNGSPEFQPPQTPQQQGTDGNSDDRGDELRKNVPEMDDMEPDPFDEDLINQYAKNAEEYVARRRVILVYKPDQEDEVRRMLGITDEKMKILYEFDELIGNDGE